jgi:hypothetical protein
MIMTITGIDHVMLAVPDLDAGRAALGARFDREIRPGSRHPGWGTANAVLRFPDSYVELITIVDRDEAAQRPAGRRITAVADAGGGWVAAVLAGTDLAETCAMLGRHGVPVGEPIDGESVRPGGRRRRWRIGAHGETFGAGRLPSMIEYLDPWPEEDPDPQELCRGGIRGVAGVDIAVTDLARRTAEYSLLLDAPPRRGERTATWTLPDGRHLRLVAPESGTDPVALHLDRVGPGLCAVALAADSPARVRDSLRTQGVRVESTADGLLIDPVATGLAPLRVVAASRRPDVRAAASRQSEHSAPGARR